MNKVYFISGLGADKRAFSLLDLSFCEPVFIDWLPPAASETLESYAARMLQQIPEPDATVVGLSFGGMLASEMARLNPQLRVIVIASNKCNGEFPRYLRIGKYLPLYKWAPDRLYRYGGRLNQWIFGARSPEAQKVFRAIQQDSDPAFVRWAISAILRWKSTTVPPGVVHIHGRHDHLLPCRYVKADFVVDNGTHILPLDFPAEVSRLLRKIVRREKFENLRIR